LEGDPNGAYHPAGGGGEGVEDAEGTGGLAEGEDERGDGEGWGGEDAVAQWAGPGSVPADAVLFELVGDASCDGVHAAAP
jgi:hypothetical protein